MPEPADELLAERLSHTIDLLLAETRELRMEQQHQRELFEARILRLEADSKDHEQRIRDASGGVIQFRQWAGLAAGGSSIVSLIAFIKAFFSP